MKIVQGVRQLPSPWSSTQARSALTIGNFDGLHLGHRALVRHVLAHARRQKIPAVVMTFEPHPVQVLYPERGLKRIFPFEDQCRILDEMGVDVLCVEPFSREFSQVQPERFVLDWVFRPFNPEILVVGYDFSFGANKQGSNEILERTAAELGFKVETLSPIEVDGAPVSSSRIRHALALGDVALAERLLGRPFYLDGLVERGVGRGRQIGVPTANLRTINETLPRLGVYSGEAVVGGRRVPCVINVGRNPTFVGESRAAISIEAHLLDFSEDLYGHGLRLEFRARLRDERKFDSAEQLVEQIHRDIAAARTRPR